MTSTREELLQVARQQFAERGFYGVSIARIAGALDISKQALLHHFKSKEKLYGEVLAQITAELTDLLDTAKSVDEDPRQQLLAALLILASAAEEDTTRSRVIMRELLDNPERAADARRWYLKPFLEDLADLLRATPAWQQREDDAALMATLYQLLGAVSYYSISGPTLRGMFGPGRFTGIRDSFPTQLEELVTQVTGSTAE